MSYTKKNSWAEVCSIIKNAQYEMDPITSFAKLIGQFETYSDMIDSFIGGLELSAEITKKEISGEDFEVPVYNILKQQAEIVGRALESVRPELAKLDEKSWKHINYESENEEVSEETDEEPVVASGRNQIMAIAKAWEKKPKGWTGKSLKQYSKKMMSGKKHPFTSCVKEMKDKEIDNPEAFCASVKKKFEGKSKK